MKEIREDPEMLDRMLEQMARETPEMPADFHARWTEAVHAEAKEQSNTGKRQEGRRQLRYILSAAAVFVFLIGGTLLTRSMKGNHQTTGDTDQNGTIPAVLSPAPEVNEPAIPYAADAAAPAAENESERMMTANEKPVTGGSGNSIRAKAAGNSYAERNEAAEAEEAAAPREIEDAAEAAYYAEEAAAMIAEEEAEEAPRTMTAADEIAEEKTSEAAKDIAETSAETPAEENGFVSFLKDLGIFTLKTLAVAAAAAVLFFGVKVICKNRKKQKNKKG